MTRVSDAEIIGKIAEAMAGYQACHAPYLDAIRDFAGRAKAIPIFTDALEMLHGAPSSKTAVDRIAIAATELAFARGRVEGMLALYRLIAPEASEAHLTLLSIWQQALQGAIHDRARWQDRETK
jgi:hypothetical protein